MSIFLKFFVTIIIIINYVRFINDIEAGDEQILASGHTILIGGESAEVVGKDQDADKMDLRKIMDVDGDN